MIGNMCRLDLAELVTWGKEFLLARLRIFTELNDGDVFADSDGFVCVVASGVFNTLCGCDILET